MTASLSRWCRATAQVRRFAAAERGTTAVEFALIAMPFTFVLIGMMSVCIYFFTMLEMEHAVWKGVRDLRVGNVQQGTGAYAGLTGDALKDAFKMAICNNTRNPGTCFSSLRVMVQARTSVASITEPNCKDGGNNLISNTTANSNWDAGGANSILLVTGCYAWEFGGNLPFFKIGNLANGSFLVQASAAIRVEPYN